MRNSVRVFSALLAMLTLSLACYSQTGVVNQFEIDQLDLSLVQKPEFSFIVISDTHVTPQREASKLEAMFDPRLKFEMWGINNRFDIPKFEKAIRQINSVKPAFVVHLGDIVTSMCFSETYNDEAKNAIELINQIEIPFHLAPGNHDVGNKRSMAHKPAPGATMEYFVCDKNEELYKSFFGDVFSSWDYEGSHFIALNVEILNTDLKDNVEQMKWLKTDLERNRNAKKIFMFGHRILFWNTPRDMGYGNYEVIDEPARSEILELIREYRVTAMFTGHTHHSIRNGCAGSQLITAPSAAFTRNTWNLYPSLPGGNHDPAKCGYYLVRVYPDRVVTNLIRTTDLLPAVHPAQQGERCSPARLVTKQSAEAKGALLMVGAPVPETTPATWGPSGLNDGFVIAPPNLLGPGNVAWGAPEVERISDGVWVKIELEEPREINRIVIYSRSMPAEYVIETSREGTNWDSVCSQKDAVQTGTSDSYTFAFPPRKATCARLTATRLRQGLARANPSCSIEEFEVCGTDGVNYALAEEGGFASSNVCTGRSEGAVNDNGWTHAYDLASRWVRVSPDHYAAWDTVERRPGVYRTSWLLDRAISNGHQENLRFVVPLSVRHPLYSGDDIEPFKSYCRYMAKKFGDRVAVWELPRTVEDAATGSPASYVCSPGEYVKKFSAMRAAILQVQPIARFAAGGLSLGVLEDVTLILEGVGNKADIISCYPPAATLIGSDKTLAHTMSLLTTAKGKYPGAEVWCLYRPSDIVDVAERGASELARAFVLLQNQGIVTGLRLRGGHSLLDEFDNPRCAFYSIRALATLFDGNPKPVDNAPISVQGKGLVQFAYRRDDGSWMVAAWAERDVEQTVDLALPPETTSAAAIDILTSTKQPLRITSENGHRVAKGVLINGSPTVVLAR